MSNLKIIESAITLRQIPEEDLNRVILTDFTVFIANLLSLKGERAMEQLEVSLPAIKEHCWSMGFAEIKKMFEMYADNKLNIEPIPNYFDRILLGKIVSAYRQQKPVKVQKKETNPMSQEEIDKIMRDACSRVFNEFKETGKLEGMVSHVYDHLDELGLLPKDIEYKNNIFKYAKAEARADARDKASVCYDSKKALKISLEKINQGLSGVKGIAKRLVLEDYFSKLIKKNETITDKLF